MGDPARNDDEPIIDNDNLDNQQDDNQNDNQDDNIPQHTESEEKALGMGWKGKDDWEGDPDDWTNAKRFLQTRDIIESNKSLRANQDRMQSEFSNRINNLQKFHEQNVNSQISALKTKRDNAASDADMDTYNQANKYIDELEKSDVSRETNKKKHNKQ